MNCAADAPVPTTATRRPVNSYQDGAAALMDVLRQLPIVADMPLADRVRAFEATYLGALDAMYATQPRLLQEAYAAGERARELRAQVLAALGRPAL